MPSLRSEFGSQQLMQGGALLHFASIRHLLHGSAPRRIFGPRFRSIQNFDKQSPVEVKFNDHGSEYDVVIICDFNIGYSDFGGLIFDTTNASINVVLSSYNTDLSNSGTFYQTFEDHSTIRVGSDQYSNTAYNGGGTGHIVLGLNAKGGSSQIDLKVLIGSKITEDGLMITGVEKTELTFPLN